MARQSINWNIVLIGGLALGGLYYYNKIRESGGGIIKTAENYTSGLTGESISTATQPTIRTDLRQAARTQRAYGRQEVRINRQDEKTARVEARQETNQNRQDERTKRVEVRQSARTERQENRIAARQVRQSQPAVNVVKVISKKIPNPIQNIVNRLKRK